MPSHVYGSGLRIVKAIISRVRNEMYLQGKNINVDVNTREIEGKAVVYADREYVLNRIIKLLKERERFVVKRQRHFNNNPTYKMVCQDMDSITEEIMKQEEQKFKNTKEIFDNMEEIEEILESMDIWQMATKWGMEDQFELYDEEKNPFGVYLCTNELKIGDVFTIPCQIFT